MEAPKQEGQTPGKPHIVTETELERLKRDVYRPDMEKFRLFTKMLRQNALLKKARITHKP